MCPRTDTPLIYRAMPQWYLAVEKIKDKMIKSNQEINWVPETIKEGRFGKWLENARDWAISRSRVWGTPLPIWINDKNGKAICMGSIADLKKYTGIEVKDLHREFVDDLNFTIPGEEGTYKRIPEVLDCWFESGSMPYAQLHYPFENQDVFKEGFPAEFIAEGLDQTRGWFYTLTVLSSALYDRPAFKNVIVNGMVLAKDGKKMSKRLRNYTPPDELIDTFGADSLRLFLINSGLVKAEELRFTDDGVKDMVRRALLPWFNSYKFFSTYAAVDGWKVNATETQSDNILDKWILSKLQTLVKNVNHEMQAYRLYNVVPELFNFIEDLTNWYIRLNRRRFWEEGMSADKNAAYSTLYTTLDSLARLMAPFTPFLSEYIYQDLKKFGAKSEESVHLCSYPEAQEGLINSTLETAVERMAQVVLLGRQKRIQEGVKVKTPLKTLKVIHQDAKLLQEIGKLEEYIKIELNIKNVEYLTNEADFVTLSAKPNLPVLGKKLGKEMGAFKVLIEKLSSAEVQKIEDGGSIILNNVSFNSEEVLVLRTAKSGTQAVTNRFVTIDLDCTLDQELIDEGLAREIVNRIQKTRKDSNFNVADRIEITIHTSDALAKVFKKYQSYISSETLMMKGSISTESLSGAMIHDIDDEKIEIKATRI
jgi:isoleucyl-tRNA synthetase